MKLSILPFIITLLFTTLINATPVPAPLPGGLVTKIKDYTRDASEKVLEKFFGMKPSDMSLLIKGFVTRKKMHIDEIKQKLSCAVCTKAVSLFGAALDKPEIITALGIWACKTLKVFEPEPICSGIIPQFVPWLKEVLQDPRFKDGERAQFCHSLVDICPAGAATFMPALPARLANLTANVETKGENVKWVVHISDLHLDVDYKEGSEGACKAFLCCRSDSTDGTNVIKKPCGKYGAYKSDAPITLIKSALATMSKVVPRIDTVLITGDLVPHNLWETTKDKVFEELDQAITLIREGLPPNTLVIPAIGNHDTSPSNYFAPTTLAGYSRAPKDTEYAPAVEAYRKLASLYSPWLPAQAIESVKKLGQYSYSPAKGLRVISVNTNYCYTVDFFTYIVSPPDLQPFLYLTNPFTELLHPQRRQHPRLDRLRTHPSRSRWRICWIIGHHSPGTSDCLENWSHGFYEIVKRFSPRTIAGMFYGHLHTDEFEVFYSNEKNRTSSTAINMAYVAPSLAPYTDLNPGSASTKSTVQRTASSTVSPTLRQPSSQPHQISLGPSNIPLAMLSGRQAWRCP
ncbi:Metallo-dependent phosphatase-like protein [Chytridium lagenaria]|nr:Metallo-dependent phosphatase-like protein [Chytridium lagenaria]